MFEKLGRAYDLALKEREAAENDLPQASEYGEKAEKRLKRYRAALSATYNAYWGPKNALDGKPWVPAQRGDGYPQT